MKGDEVARSGAAGVAGNGRFERRSRGDSRRT